MRGSVTRTSGHLGALVGLVAASALVCGLFFMRTDVSRSVSAVGPALVPEHGGFCCKGGAGWPAVAGELPVLSPDSTGFLASYLLLLGPPELFWSRGEWSNLEFSAWSRACGLGALAWYWFDYNKREVSVGLRATEHSGG